MREDFNKWQQKELRYFLVNENEVGPHGLSGDLWNGVTHIASAVDLYLKDPSDDQSWSEGMERLRQVLPQAKGFTTYYRSMLENYNHMAHEEGMPELDEDYLVTENLKHTTPEVVVEYDGLTEELKSLSDQLDQRRDQQVVNRCHEILDRLHELVYGSKRRRYSS